MRRKKELLELKEKLILLKKDLRLLYEYHKPKRHLLLFSKGDISMASDMIEKVISIGTQIRLIDFFLGGKSSLTYLDYDYETLREDTDDWIKDVPK